MNQMLQIRYVVFQTNVSLFLNSCLLAAYTHVYVHVLMCNCFLLQNSEYSQKGRIGVVAKLKICIITFKFNWFVK